MNDAKGKGRILDEALSVDAVLSRVSHGGAGGEVVFIGAVRDHVSTEDGKMGVALLEYEAYPEMAEKVLSQICLDVEGEIAGSRCAVDHRVGILGIGDRAVVVAASAAHRAEAFAAARAVIEALKKDVPIWKHETRDDGVVWVGLGP
ncbi:MAG: molybdopterin synthase [Deltaproteobacteria bacterium]|nr:molybdopterin synthase [Deltaproteobacteria bacterium]